MRDKMPSFPTPDSPDIRQKDETPVFSTLNHIKQQSNIIKSYEMVPINVITKKETNSDKNNILMAKISENEEENIIQRTIEFTSTAVIVNKRITTPITLEIKPTHGISTLNVAKYYRNIFSATK